MVHRVSASFNSAKCWQSHVVARGGQWRNLQPTRSMHTRTTVTYTCNHERAEIKMPWYTKFMNFMFGLNASMQATSELIGTAQDVFGLGRGDDNLFGGSPKSNGLEDTLKQMQAEIDALKEENAELKAGKTPDNTAVVDPKAKVTTTGDDDLNVDGTPKLNTNNNNDTDEFDVNATLTRTVTPGDEQEVDEEFVLAKAKTVKKSANLYLESKFKTLAASYKDENGNPVNDVNGLKKYFREKYLGGKDCWTLNNYESKFPKVIEFNGKTYTFDKTTFENPIDETPVANTKSKAQFGNIGLGKRTVTSAGTESYTASATVGTVTVTGSGATAAAAKANAKADAQTKLNGAKLAAANAKIDAAKVDVK